MEPRLPTFDLIVATVGRTAEPAALLDSLRDQTHRAFRVILVDQNDDDRLASVVARYEGALQVERIPSEPGLSSARNAGLALVSADVVAFPDDDCAYPPELLERVGRVFADRQDLDVLTGRTADTEGHSAPRWGTSRATVDRHRVWHGGNSASTFVRREAAARIGPFDERLGLGSGTPWSSGEDIDYLVRAVAAGARVEYDPEIVIVHELRRPGPASLAELGRRDGASVGYILGKHRYPPRAVGRLLLRPLGGALVSLARRDLPRARFHLQTLVGRIEGYRAGRSP